MTTLQVLYHGNCFDGVVSAAIFTRFYAERVDPRAVVRYRGMGHSHADPYGADHAAVFDADVNAVVDFRYSPSPRLDWWCDHHQTTFLRPEDEEQLRRDGSGRKRYDPEAPSCAGLLCGWLAEAHGLDNAALREHVRWADVIDAARFVSPSQAVELREPALQLMTLLEAASSALDAASLVESMIRGLARGSIEEVWREAEVQRALRPVLVEHERAIGLFRAHLQIEQGVAFFDLTDAAVDGFNKFIPYYLAQGLRYTVGVTASPRRAKVSVGSNPWERPAPLVNLGELCRRYGGGGHATVGAVSLPPDRREEARQAAREIAALLRTSHVM